MEKIIASCGIECHECPAYKATKNNDDVLRKETAKNWSKMFDADIKPENINCLGCHSDVLFAHCKECEIRKCNTDKNLKNCSECEGYTCEKINNFFTMVPDAKKVLDSLL